LATTAPDSRPIRVQLENPGEGASGQRRGGSTTRTKCEIVVQEDGTSNAIALKRMLVEVSRFWRLGARGCGDVAAYGREWGGRVGSRFEAASALGSESRSAKGVNPIECCLRSRGGTESGSEMPVGRPMVWLQVECARIEW
jgi:hypothetical protein